MNNWKRTFAIIWTGQFVSIITSVTVNFAIILWLTMETGSGEMLAWASVAGLLPQALLGPVAGVYIDRWNRKRTMIVADVFIALCTLVLAFLFWFELIQVNYIFIVLALRSIGSAFHMPAMQAAIPMIAPKEQLTRIAGINQMITSTGTIAGPALAALLITNIDIEYVLLLDVFGAVIACVTLLMVTIPDPEKTVRKIGSVFTQIKEGAGAVLQNRGLSWVFLFVVLLTLFYMPVSVLLPLMTANYFGGKEFAISLVEIVWGVGALVGGAIIGTKVYKINRIVLLNISYLICGVSVLISGLLSTEGFNWFVSLIAIGGIAGGIYNSLFTGIVQTNIGADLLGRVFSMFYSLHIIPAMLGLIGIGFFTDTLGVNNTFIICGIVLILIGFLAFTTPSALRLDRKSSF